MRCYRLPELLRNVGERRPFNAIRELGSHRSLQNAINLKLGTESIVIESELLTQRWLFNRHRDHALQLLKHIQSRNPFLTEERIAVIAWLLLGSIIPRGANATETSFVARTMLLRGNARERSQDYQRMVRVLAQLRHQLPVTSNDIDVHVDAGVGNELATKIEKSNANTIKLINIIPSALDSMNLWYLRELTVFDNLSDVDKIQSSLENVVMHRTRRLDESKRQQIRIDDVNYHLAALTAMLEAIHNKILQDGAPSVTATWLINTFCITGSITQATANNCVLEINHLGHNPPDSNPVNTGRASNLVNQTQKVCSVFKLRGCVCSTGQCVLKVAYLESRHYFEQCATAASMNPLSKYYGMNINELRQELAFDIVQTCSHNYYPSPGYLILILMGLDNR